MGLGRESLWLDEAKAATLALEPLSRWWTDLPSHLTPPGHFLILKWVSWFSISDAALRLPSAFAGWLSILLLWRLARARAGSAVALVAALWWTLCPAALLYSAEARPYALWVLAELCALASLLRGLSPTQGKSSPFLVGVLQPIPAILHYNSVAFLLGRIGLMAIYWKRLEKVDLSRFFSGFAAAMLVVIPWALHQYLSMPPANVRVHTEWADLDLNSLTRIVGDLFGFEYPFRPLAWFFVGASLFGLVIHRSGSKETVVSSQSWGWILMVVLPILALTPLLVGTDRYLASRHFLPVLPLLLLESARAVSALALRFPSGIRPALLVLVAVVPAAFWGVSAWDQRVVADRAPWRDVADFVAQQGEGEVAYLAVGDNVSVLDYYRRTRNHSYIWIMDSDGPPFDRMGGPETSGPYTGLPPETDMPLAGVVVAGQEDGGESYRELLESSGKKPDKVWHSRRINPIEFYRGEGRELEDLLQNTEHKRVGSHP